jgi:hypothetical protein
MDSLLSRAKAVRARLQAADEEAAQVSAHTALSAPSQQVSLSAPSPHAHVCEREEGQSSGVRGKRPKREKSGGDGRDGSERPVAQTPTPTPTCAPRVPSLVLDRVTLEAALGRRMRNPVAVAELELEVRAAIRRYQFEVSTGALGVGPLLVRGYPLALWLGLDVLAALLAEATDG